MLQLPAALPLIMVGSRHAILLEFTAVLGAEILAAAQRLRVQVVRCGADMGCNRAARTILVRVGQSGTGGSAPAADAGVRSLEGNVPNATALSMSSTVRDDARRGGGPATVAAACERVVDCLVEAGVELPSVYLLAGGRLRCIAARGYFQVVDGFLPGTGVIGAAVAQAAEIFLPDVRSDPSFIAAIPGLAGEACVPVIVDGHVVGAVNAESTGPLPLAWMPALRTAAAWLAEHIAASGGLPAPSETQRLARIVVELGGLTDVQAIQELTVQAATDLSAMGSALLALDHDGTLVPAAACGPLADRLRAFRPADLAVMAGWVLAGTSSHLPDGHDMPAPHDFLARAGIRSLSAHPLTVAGSNTGILVAVDTDPHPLDPAEIEAVELLAAQAATSIATATALDILRRRAAEDPLTGCRNFGAFVAELASGMARQPRDAHLACVIVDVDDFKKINDDFGHPAGDDLLVALAGALRGALRGTDRLYRIGGDEFAVTSYLVDESATYALARRLVRVARDVGASVSVGAAWAGPGDDAASLRDRADQALYDAKHAGRNTARLR